MKCFLALLTYGTNDVLTWEGAVEKLKADGTRLLYVEGAPTEKEGELRKIQLFNHPPAVIHLLYAWDSIARVTDLPLRGVIRLTASFADAVALWIAYLTAVRSGVRIQTAAWLLLAVNPIGIMVAGFHGNTDTIMICFLLACIYFLTIERMRLGGAMFGLAMSIKIVPILVLPVALFWIRKTSERVAFVATAGLVFAAATLPYSLEYPMWVRHVFGYESSRSPWGFGFTRYVLTELQSLYWLYIPIAKYLIAGAIAVVAWRVNRWQERPCLLAQMGFSFAVFLFLTPGFGVQYLCWLAPFCVVLGTYATAAYCLFVGGFAFHLYTLWSGGLPWYFANAYRYSGPAGWTAAAQFSSYLAWLCIGALLAMYVWSMVQRHPKVLAVARATRSG